MKAVEGSFAAQPYLNELAQLYDVAVPDWPGEIEFYTQLIRQIPSTRQPSLLEVACGTGRVTLQLARLGVPIVGIDLSDEMLAFARGKSLDVPHVRWILADMRSFELAQTFDLAIVPAYSFQLLLTEDDRQECLSQIARHLNPGARVVLHLEKHPPDWIASLPTDTFTPFEAAGETVHPGTGQRIRVSYAWSHAPDTQSLAVIMRYQVLGRFGQVTASTTDRGPLKMHYTSPHELREQLARAGFKTEAIFGDFFDHPYDSNSEEMIWIARKSVVGPSV
ncbi:class I SAM-dependent methyltransferase [Candidatus Bipolaricaulota bacterium]|nr:class I SAM-dependent methyltransferase [Candidatus Bipolaricaulota bacterium]